MNVWMLLHAEHITNTILTHSINPNNLKHRTILWTLRCQAFSNKHFSVLVIHIRTSVCFTSSTVSLGFEWQIAASNKRLGNFLQLYPGVSANKSSFGTKENVHSDLKSSQNWMHCLVGRYKNSSLTFSKGSFSCVWTLKIKRLKRANGKKMYFLVS